MNERILIITGHGSAKWLSRIMLFRQTVDEEAEAKMAEDMRRQNYEPKLSPVLISQLLRGMIAKAPESKSRIEEKFYKTQRECKWKSVNYR